MNKAGERSIRGKLFFYLIVIIAVPFLFISIVQNTINAMKLKEVALNNTREILDQVDELTYQFIGDIVNLTNMLSEDVNIKNFARGENSESTRFEIESMFKMVEDNYSQIAGLLIVNSKDDYISNKLDRRFRDPIITDEWYKQTVTSDQKISFFSMPIERNLTTYENYSPDEVISIAMAVNDDSGNQNTVLLLDIKLKSLEDKLKSVKIGNEGFIYILDKDNNMIFVPNNDIVYRIENDQILKGNTKGYKIKIRDDIYQSMHKNVSGLDWNIVGIFPVSSIYDSIHTSQLVTAIMTIILMLVIVVVLKKFDNQFTRPIMKLNETMGIVESGNLDVRFDYDSNDEIGSLGRKFNSMILEVNKLIRLVDLEHEKTRQAEFRIMQSQINPHFLYNTLDTINWIAREYNIKDIENIVMALTRLFRITLNKGNEFVALGDEIDHVRSYLIIQKMRYEDLFDYEINVDKDIEDSEVIKLILQPLVENAIYHGIKESDRRGFIRISAREIENKICIDIRDNGVGLLPDKVNDINEMFKSQNHKLGFGLYNVNTRIINKYGNSYGLKIESVKNEYTIISLTHPLVQGGGNENIDC